MSSFTTSPIFQNEPSITLQTPSCIFLITLAENIYLFTAILLLINIEPVKALQTSLLPIIDKTVLDLGILIDLGDLASAVQEGIARVAASALFGV